jgi:hypothetical protein
MTTNFLKQLVYNCYKEEDVSAGDGGAYDEVRHIHDTLIKNNLIQV